MRKFDDDEAGVQPYFNPASEDSLRATSVEALRVRFEHWLRLEQLPRHPRDPLDRMLAAPTLKEKPPDSLRATPLLPCGPIFEKYPVKVIR
jgi:PIN domain nuclease of toxin-antitoxin system